MASGKSKLGKRVARELGAPFLDTDKMVEAEHGDIPTIFARDGEEQFRTWEREAVTNALAHGGVVSLGGGAILDSQTRADLARETVIYLHIRPEVVARHVNMSTRPLLADGMEAWERIFEERRPLYESVATVDFDTSSAHLANLTTEVAGWIKLREAGSHE
jgi:shikimate kinase